MLKPKLTIVGGGLVGAALAYGAARLGADVRLLDGGDQAFRASRGNFGLIWLSSKGGKCADYARWARDAVAAWPEFHDELFDLTHVDTGLRQDGGFWLGFDETEVEAREALLSRINAQAGDIPFEMLGAAELRERLPGLGRAVVGGSFGPLDGHANPLSLLRALYSGLTTFGAEVVSGVEVERIEYSPWGTDFTLWSRDGAKWPTERVVIAAGIGTTALARQVGVLAPTETTRGQVLITERLQPFLRFPTNKLRQTGDGSVQIGSTSEDVGLDDTTTSEKIIDLARRAVAQSVRGRPAGQPRGRRAGARRLLPGDGRLYARHHQ